MPLPLDAKPSDESGDRRQDAANDHGSRKDNEYHVREIVDLHTTFGRDNAVAYLEKLLSEVSARSADAEEVLDRLAKKMEDASRHAAKLSDLYAADRLFVHAAEFDTASRVWELAREDVLSEIQNQFSEPGQGSAR